MKDTLSTLLPAALTVLFAFGAGFHTAAYSSVWALWLFLGVAAVVFGGTPLWAPFGDLLPRGLWPLLWAIAAASCALSVVPRAGFVGLALAPLVVLLAGVVPSGDLRGRAIAGLNGALVVVASFALGELLLRAAKEGLSARAAMPLGHHNLLALFLLPLLLLALVEWRERRTRLAGTAFAVGSVTLLATFSLSGLFGYVVGIAVALRRTRSDEEASYGRIERVVAVTSLIVLALLFAPRVGRVVLGTDASAGVRATYAEASWRGFLERPLLGHGPGSAGWLLPNFLTPRLGVNPGGEVVSDPHSLLLLALFETGLVGGLLLLALCVVLVGRLLRASSGAAALAGTSGFLAMGLVAGWFGTPAVWIPLLLVLGTAIERSGERRTIRTTTLLGVALCVVLLWSPARAHLAFDRATGPGTSDEAALAHLERSVALDPGFPLYRFWYGRWSGEPSLLAPAVVDAQALFALDAATRSAPDEALAALRSACRVDPLAPWSQLLLSARESGLRSTLLAARAVALDPRLLAWVELDGTQIEGIVASLERDPRLPPGWRESLLADGGRVLDVLAEGAAPTLASAELRMDEFADTSVSLFAFRRRPISDVVVDFVLDLRRVEAIETPPLSSVARDVEAGFLDPALCSAPLEAAEPSGGG